MPYPRARARARACSTSVAMNGTVVETTPCPEPLSSQLSELSFGSEKQTKNDTAAHESRPNPILELGLPSVGEMLRTGEVSDEFDGNDTYITFRAGSFCSFRDGVNLGTDQRSLRRIIAFVCMRACSHMQTAGDDHKEATRTAPELASLKEVCTYVHISPTAFSSPTTVACSLKLEILQKNPRVPRFSRSYGEKRGILLRTVPVFSRMKKLPLLGAYIDLDSKRLYRNRKNLVERRNLI